MTNDIVQVKQESILRQEQYIADQVKNIDNENTKSGIIIAFIGTIIALTFSNIKDYDLCFKIYLFIISLLPILVALWNIWSKEVGYYINVNDVFVRSYNYSNYEKFLNDMHNTLNITHKNVEKLLIKKALLNKITSGLTAFLFINILFINIFLYV